MRILFFFMLLAMLTTNWWPPHNADGQPGRMPPAQIFTAPPEAPDTSAATLIAEIDSNTIKAAMLNDKTRKILNGQDELSKTIPKHLRETKKEDTEKPVILVKVRDTVEKPSDTTCVFVHDNSMDGKGWWYQYRCLLKKCNIHKKVAKLFKRKK